MNEKRKHWLQNGKTKKITPQDQYNDDANNILTQLPENNT